MRFIITCSGLFTGYPCIQSRNKSVNSFSVSFMHFIFNKSLNANHSCKFNHCLWISFDVNTKYKGNSKRRLILVISNHQFFTEIRYTCRSLWNVSSQCYLIHSHQALPFPSLFGTIHRFAAFEPNMPPVGIEGLEIVATAFAPKWFSDLVHEAQMILEALAGSELLVTESAHIDL